MGRHDLEPEDVIYSEMLDKSRRSRTTPPEGTPEAMAWAPTVDDRPDGSWCEDRPLYALTDHDGID